METSIDASGGMRALVSVATDPMLTFCDDDTGERTALSADQLRGWVGRTANLLARGCGLSVGARAMVLMSPHWHTAAVLLGAWSAGVSVEYAGEATGGLPRLGPGHDTLPDVVFAAPHRIDNWIDDIPSAPHRFVVGGAANGYRDYLTEVERYDDTVRVAHHGADAASRDGTSYAEWAAGARAMALRWDLRPGDRVLLDAAEHEHPLMWLLAPLSAGASVVLCANVNPALVDERIAAERITRVL